jgi:hypothetical protein
MTGEFQGCSIAFPAATARVTGQRRVLIGSADEHYARHLPPPNPNRSVTQGSGKITGTWEALDGGGDIFTDPGTVSPSGAAVLQAGGGQPGVEAGDRFTVNFVFESNSPASTNHPTFSGTWDTAWTTGPQSGEKEGEDTGTVRAIRCSSSTSAKAIAGCRF